MCEQIQGVTRDKQKEKGLKRKKRGKKNKRGKERKK
jgi:hypothetical protein